MTKTLEFWEWVDTERNKKGISYRTIERAGGLSNGAVSKRANDKSEPTLENCRAVASALGYPLEMVLRKAGILPSVSGVPGMDELLAEIRTLRDEYIQVVLHMVRGIKGGLLRPTSGVSYANTATGETRSEISYRVAVPTEPPPAQGSAFRAGPPPEKENSD